MNAFRVALLTGAGLAISAPAIAQDTPPPAPAPSPEAERGTDDDFHTVIVVTSGGLQRLDVLAGTSVVRGDDLQRNMNGQIGEVLTHVPGVSATSFSPGASRPVLRGFQGDRVRVLVDGIGSIDASNTSTDHAVTIDPLTADRIEVLRGPAVLLYGSSAIGGAVNVIDKRIPLRVPQETLHVDALFAADTAYDLREGGASIDAPVTGGLAVHIDGSYRNTDDLRVPGFVLAEPLRQEVLADAAEELEEGHADEAGELVEAANLRGRLPNSATETYSLGGGAAWIGSGASLGASVGYYDSLYGVPARPGAQHHHEEGGAAAEPTGEADVSIGLQQWRADFRGSLDLGDGFLERLTTRWGYSDYTHTEFEGDEVGTTFWVEGVEGRAELIQRERGAWRGSSGAQYLFRDFAAEGAEAFVPANTTESIAAFTLQEVELEPIEIELGARYEHTALKAPTLGIERSFGGVSGALGIAWNALPGLRLGVNGSRSVRAPSAEELFANGPHPATQQFEIGDPALSREASWGLEGYARGSVGPAEISFAVFKNWFDDFIFLQPTSAEEDGLPVYRQMQQDADYFGIEGEITLPLFSTGGIDVVADGKGDYIRATLADGSPVPRIPPLSLLGGLELLSDSWDARAEVEWYAAQDRIAALETRTGSFAFVNASLAWKPLRGDDNVTVMLQADNLFDAEGRRHASFTKDFVPLAGRNVKLSARLSF